MANKRMFSKDIVAGSQFIMMPSTARDLYFFLGLFADDDGYCEYVSVIRLIAADNNDLKTLQENGFICVYNLYTLCIQDWYTHNKIPPSRYAESKYLKIFPERDLPLNKQYNPILKACIQDVHNVSVEGSIDKGSIEEVREEIPYVEIVKYLNDTCRKKYKAKSKATQRLISARTKEGFTVEDFKKVIKIKHTEWKDDVKMSAFLRPETLFGTKFESYLNQKPLTPEPKQTSGARRIIK